MPCDVQDSRPSENSNPANRSDGLKSETSSKCDFPHLSKRLMERIYFANSWSWSSSQVTGSNPVSKNCSSSQSLFSKCWCRNLSCPWWLDRKATNHGLLCHHGCRVQGFHIEPVPTHHYWRSSSLSFLKIMAATFGWIHDRSRGISCSLVELVKTPCLYSTLILYTSLYF